MATKSFYEDLIIDTPEAARNLERAVEQADERGPVEFPNAKGPSHDPDFIRRLVDNYREESKS